MSDDETTPEEEPEQRPRGRLFGLLGLVAAVVALGVVLYVFVFSSSGSPTDVVDDYFQALKDGDVATARDLTCAAAADDLGAVDPDGGASADLQQVFGDITWKVTGETVTGDRAVVTVDMSGLGGDTTEGAPIDLIKEKGDWKVCGDATDPSPEVSAS
ncbi:hypothetical protein Afil01_48410 [Actinorhabdospora filicis]|uniref:DUF4878 domain-containing protein n=1 Tax=Actinorhabdospora filicis TaxID=1785913 RepID=A0A9W6SQA1_9ACTN|nr:DUF4878 domain-containing protein [Actinorhabdospora filicis]GLZ80034.1 hypothetical protein Afil01_48410 [Actinorhabdospora filicis]